MDGSLGSATAYFFKAYEDTPSNHGLLADDAVPLGKMEQRMLAADQAGLQLSIHAIGDRANHILLNLFQKVAESNGLLVSTEWLQQNLGVSGLSMPSICGGMTFRVLRGSASLLPCNLTIALMTAAGRGSALARNALRPPMRADLCWTAAP